MQIAVQVAPGLSGTQSVTMTADGGGASAPATTVRQFTVSGTPAGFGIMSGSLELPMLRENGDVADQAGEHPASFTTRLDFNRRSTPGPAHAGRAGARGAGRPAARLRGRPDRGPAVPVPAAHQRDAGAPRGFGCPDSTQVGFVNNFTSRAGRARVPVYNIEPPPDLPALFAFNTPIGPTVTMSRSCAATATTGSRSARGASIRPSTSAV